MRHYHFLDYATQAYVALVGLLILFFHGGVIDYWLPRVLAHAGWLLAAHWLIVHHAKAKTGKVLDFLRHFYPLLLYIPIYNETGHLNQMFMTGIADPWFIKLDQVIFGCQPSLVFMERLPWLPVSELFYISYFSYYLMITGVGLALFLRDRNQFRHYLSLVSFVFYLCFLIYIFLPVVGPRIFYRDLVPFDLPAAAMPAVVPPFPEAVQAGPFYRIMAVIYHYFETPGAAFPSSHVAVALTTVYFSRKYLPRIWKWHAVVAALLCLSTVYCRYHYAVDIAGGVLLTVLALPLGNWLMARCPASPKLAQSRGAN